MAGMSSTATTYGGYAFNQQLSLDVYKQSQPLMRWVQFCDLEEKFGQRAGKTFLFDKELDVDDNGGEFSEGGEVPESQGKIIQSSITLKLRGLAIPYTEMLMIISMIDLPESIRRRLVNSIAKVHNIAAATQFQATKMKYCPRGDIGAPEWVWDSDGTISYAAQRSVGVVDVIAIIEAMKSKQYINSDGTLVATASPVEPYDDDGNFICITSVGGASAIRKDDDFIRASLYGDPDRLFAGEIGRFHGVRFIEDNHVLSNLLGTTAYKGEMIFFGNQTVKRWVALPPEIREDVATQLGTKMRQGWVSIEGYKIIWEFNGTAGDTYEPMNTICHVTST